MNAISQPFASYIVRDEAIRIALNKAVREDESHSALVAAGFQAILAALVVSPSAVAEEPRAGSAIEVTSFQRDLRTCNALMLSKHEVPSSEVDTDDPPLEQWSGLSDADDERTIVQSLASAQIISAISANPLTIDGPAVAPADTIAGSIVSMRHSGQTECRIRLDAPNFGLVDIRLIANGANVSARLTMANLRSMQSMAEVLPSIVARLEQAGVKLGGMELAHRQTPGDQSAESPLGDTDIPEKDRGPAVLVPLIIRGRLDVTV